MVPGLNGKDGALMIIGHTTTQAFDWNRAPLWKKRLHGFACYVLMALVSLYDPIAVDLVLFKVLSRQFGKDVPR